MTTQQSNFRLPPHTLDQIERLAEIGGLTKVQIIIIAVDRLARDLGQRTGAPAVLEEKLERRAEEEI